ncbi:MAG TPA: FG-GAP-like repeat-containing protein, partial [Steroidobacteraceae bacterium]
MRYSSRIPGSYHGPGRSQSSLGRQLRQAAAVLSLTSTLTFVAGFGNADQAFDVPNEYAVIDSAASRPDDSLAQDLAAGVSVGAAAANLPATVEAGKTPGTVSVTASGAAGYSIPLWTPPGVGNVDLKLALQYSSRGGNGVLGQGWSLGGLSVIETCNGTVAQDGPPGPLVPDAMKRLCLDGQQLKLVSGTYGAPGAVYATEIESFSRIAQISTGLNSAFIVTTRNGLVYEYGTTPDSHVHAQSGPRHAWALARIRDRQTPASNQINITYQNDAQFDFYNNGTNIGSYRVLRITYPTTSSGQGPYYQVDFSYSARPTADAFLGYVAGSFIREPNELDNITIRPYGSTGVIKSYNLAYDAGPSTGRLRLATVTECSATSCMRPTRIAYQAGSSAFLAMAKANASATGLTSSVPIDLNGDGLQDLMYPKANGSGYSRWWVLFANTTGFGTALDTGITTANSNKVIAGQFSGRGANQLLMVQNGYWHVVTQNGLGFISMSTGVPVNGEFGAVDWDGDGLPDLASIVGTELRVRRNTTVPPGAVTFDATPFVATTSIGGYIAYNASSMTSQADFNADGRGDIVASYFDADLGYTTVVLLSNGFAVAPSYGLPGGLVDTSRLADFNADGCTDIVALNATYVSACDGTFRTVSNGTLTTIPGSQVVADVDGDGKTDLLFIHSQQKTWYFARSRGDSYSAPVSLGIPAPNGTSWFVFDQNGDGLIDLGYRDDVNGGALKYHLHVSTASPADAAVSFTDGLGITQSVAYVPISRSNYQRHSDAAFPEIDVQLPLYVVSDVTADTGTATDYRLQYFYYGARMHLQGRGFEGFGAVRTYDSRTGLYRMDTLQRAFPYAGMVTQSTVLQGNLTTKVLETSATLAVQTLGNVPYQQRYFPFVQSSTESQYELGGTLNGTLISRTVSSFTYGDAYGNLTAATRTITDKDPGSPFLGTSWQSSLTASYYNDSANNCLG